MKHENKATMYKLFELCSAFYILSWLVLLELAMLARGRCWILTQRLKGRRLDSYSQLQVHQHGSGYLPVAVTK